MRHPKSGDAKIQNIVYQQVIKYMFLSDEVRKETGTLLEINNSSLNPVRHKVKAHDNNLEILRLCKQYEVPVILGSDAHISFSIAQYDHIYPLLQEVDFPDALILNDKPEQFKCLLKPLPA